MEIKFLQKLDSTGDFTALRYSVNGKTVTLEVGGTAMSMFDWDNLSPEELGDVFTPLLWQVSVELSEQGALLEKIKMDSEGLKDLQGKIIYSREQVQQILDPKKGVSHAEVA